MTRRVIKPQPNLWPDSKYRYDGLQNGLAAVEILYKGEPAERYFPCFKPRYEVGDILYVRETWLHADDGFHYKANATMDSEILRKAYGYKWKSSMFMPREVARLFLEVKKVCCERVQDISEEDARAEGVLPFPLMELKQLPNSLICPGGAYGKGYLPEKSYKAGYYKLWEELNAKRGYSWGSNPWVWVYEFMRTDKC
jgi:hypothetical protein